MKKINRKIHLANAHPVTITGHQQKSYVVRPSVRPMMTAAQGSEIPLRAAASHNSAGLTRNAPKMSSAAVIDKMAADPRINTWDATAKFLEINNIPYDVLNRTSVTAKKASKDSLDNVNIKVTRDLADSVGT